MKEDRLKKVIRSLYLLRKVLLQKQEDDTTFRIKPKTTILSEVDLLIDRRLEEFYSLRLS